MLQNFNVCCGLVFAKLKPFNSVKEWAEVVVSSHGIQNRLYKQISKYISGNIFILKKII